jgi:hypothetical protein
MELEGEAILYSDIYGRTKCGNKRVLEIGK